MLEMRGISKRFPGVLANDHVSFDVRAGEVHTLLGENGAGKSTLMKILFGLYRADEGEILFNGKPLRISSPSAAIAAGIGMIHQHFMLVPTLTVTENVALGLSSSGLKPNLAEVEDRVRALADQYGLQVDPRAEVWQLAVGERQRVEILKALYREAQLLVLDEPTAVLTPQEVDDFFVTLRKLAEDGRGLIFISHKLHEVLALSDRITVLRDGRVAGNTTPAETSREQLAEMMVGRPVKLAPDKPEIELGEARLAVHDLSVRGDRDHTAVDGISFQVRAGEILGIAGVSGNGQRELAEAVAGLRPPDRGSIRLDDVEVAGASPREIRAAGLAYVPEERMRDGAIGAFTISENLMLLDHDSPDYSRRGWLDLGALNERAEQLVKRFDVKTPSVHTATRSLSGGNIQKVIMAREITSGPAVLVAAQPTRGVDIGAAEYIHHQLVEQRGAGTAIVVISEDLDEVLALADRVAVMFEGRIVGVVDRADCTPEGLGLLMAGG
jgi:simple sugar transport system ATP-binding protein